MTIVSRWIEAARSHGYSLKLTGIPRRPVWIDAPPNGFGDEWDQLAPTMRAIGLDRIAEALTSEFLNMSAKEWVVAMRSYGFAVELNAGRSAETMPVLVYSEEPDTQPPPLVHKALARLGIDAVAAELRRERLS